MIAIIV